MADAVNVLSVAFCRENHARCAVSFRPDYSVVLGTKYHKRALQHRVRIAFGGKQL